MASPKLFILKNYDLLCEEVTHKILTLSNRVIEKKGQFRIALAGGVTPKGLYLRMSDSNYKNLFDWQKIHFFWGDERWVPTDHIRSNYRMVAEALLTRVDIPPENIHPMITKKEDAESTAMHYQEHLIKQFELEGGELPNFDLVLLGVGHDGHVASIFLDSPSMKENERMAMASLHVDIEEPRITLTLPVINNADQIFIMASGIEKADAVQKALEPESEQGVLPVHLVEPEHGSVSWFLDSSAASHLRKAIK